MKKALAFVMSLTLMAAMLTGCGSAASSSEAPAPAESSVAEESKEEAAESSEEAGAADYSNEKIAVIFNSVIVDGGYNEGIFNHMNDLQKQYGFQLSYQENVGDTEINDVLRNYASDGYGLILDAEQYHCEQIAEIAPEFPDTKFGCINGYVACAPNFMSVASDMWQHVYLGGVMSGMVTKSNKIGLITFSTNSDSALTMLAAYSEGAKAGNPDCEVIHVATGSFSDLAAGKEMAASLVSQGCDVILCNSGDCNPAVIEYCIEQGVYSVSAITNRNDFDEKYVLGSTVTNNNAMVDMIVLGYLEGGFDETGSVYVGGLNEGIEEFVINPTVMDDYPQEVFDKIDEIKGKIESGEITVELPSSK